MMMRNVERGCAILDAATPGWQDRIDLETLDLSDPCQCILGQLYRTFGMGAIMLKLSWRETEEAGFAVNVITPTANTADTAERYRQLTDTWRAVLRKERMPDAGH